MRDLISAWKSKFKGILINDVKNILSNRKGYKCDHCERQYDDDICDACLAKLLVDKFQQSLVKAEAERTKQ